MARVHNHFRTVPGSLKARKSLFLWIAQTSPRLEVFVIHFIIFRLVLKVKLFARYLMLLALLILLGES